MLGHVWNLDLCKVTEMNLLEVHSCHLELEFLTELSGAKSLRKALALRSTLHKCFPEDLDFRGIRISQPRYLLRED